VFARKLNLLLAEGDSRRPAPREWLDQFFMRNFIGLSAFDETLVTGDGEMETGLDVAPGLVQEHFEKWLRGRKLIGAGVRLEVTTR
jgi:hypothetical protein